MVKLRRIGDSNAVVITNAAGSEILVSYSTVVAAIIDGKAYKTETRWSNTTSRHISRFLDGMKATVKPQSFFDKLL